MNERLSLAIPCRADEPGLGATLESLYVACQHPAFLSGLTRELLICINGAESEAACTPLLAVREFCSRYDVPLQELWISPGETVKTQKDGNLDTKAVAVAGAAFTLNVSALPSKVIPQCLVLLTKRAGKPLAWNMLWRQASGEVVLFCDADVRVDPAAIVCLYKRLQREPQLQLVAAREIPMIEGKGTVWGRMGALGYRFDFGNVGGRLLLMRKGALSDGMPEDLLLEDAWLTVAVGRQQVAKEWQAQVYFLPPATGRDYFAERVRTEGGKLQIRRLHGHLLRQGPIATYRWPQFFTNIAVREYPLVAFGLLVRGVAYVWARLAVLNKEFYALYRPFRTTKHWTES